MKKGWIGNLMLVIAAGVGLFLQTPGARADAPGFVEGTYSPGWNLAAAPLVAYSGRDSTVIDKNVGIPQLNGAIVVTVSGTGYIANNYLDGWTDPGMVLSPGRAFFFRNPTPNNLDYTSVGLVYFFVQNFIPHGYSMPSSISPLSTTFPELQFEPFAGTRVYLWDKSTESFNRFTFSGEWSPSVPLLERGEGFGIFTPGPNVWTQSFGDADDMLDYYSSAVAGVTSTVGEVNTMTYNHTNANLGRVFDADGVRPVHAAFKGQFYRSIDSGTTFAPVGQPERFLNRTFAGYLRGGSSKIPGTVDEQTCTLQLRVWEASYGSTYEQAVSNGGRHGSSESFSLTAHAPIGANGPGKPPRLANLFANFSVNVGSDLRPRFTEILRQGSGARLRVILPPGETYRVLYADSIAATTWEVVSEISAVTGQGALVELTGPAISPHQKRFYRLQRVP